MRHSGITDRGKTFEFRKVRKVDVKNTIEGLPRKTSSGDEYISYIEIKDGEFYVTEMLTEIVNRITELGHWPSQWVNSILKPLYNGKGDRLQPGLYRPVAVTSALSRTVERLLNDQLVDFFISNGMIANECHGFTPG